MKKSNNPEPVTPGNTDAESYSHRKALKTGLSLHQAVARMADLRYKEEGYPSRSGYLAGLVVFDFYCGHKHWLTAKLMKEPLYIQEKVFAELLENRQQQSTWFEHRIQEIITERIK